LSFLVFLVYLGFWNDLKIQIFFSYVDGPCCCDEFPFLATLENQFFTTFLCGEISYQYAPLKIQYIFSTW